ncbi:tyrosine-type recombinase/integrase [Chelativorans intermedius]|uniref:Tyrosine-type recombinase/integrase n=1 Tax=Chelativorans intermedius TaxID=515947 RepID=A0ABV6D9T8_9HYPH|nr:tyrosine-type recombinase/integrase [Chelativorans intermedius]MCT8999112.1 tyrosine-type recombinase/integrase [Chelativorans intermedius]
MMNRRRLPKYVSEFSDRHGKMRVRFRRKGQADYYFKALPWTDEFMQEYRACLDGKAAPAVAPGAARTRPGTISALIVAYYGSPEFNGLADSTKATYRGILERFRAKHGDKRVAALERKHIKAIIGAMADRPAAANNLLDRLKALMALAVDIGMRKDDPTIRLRGYSTKGDGFHTWTEDEIAQFERRHPPGTKPRLALALMLYTGQRRSDVVVMGRQHLDGDTIKVSQQKTRAKLRIPLHPQLREIIKATPVENMTFLTTAFGKPFTPAGFGNWFRDRCDEAGLPHCSAHGLRKAAARRLAEAGCTNQQIKAITGHKTDKEVSRYTAAADQSRLATEAMATAYGMEREQKLSNREKGLDKTAAKPLKRKEG